MAITKCLNFHETVHFGSSVTKGCSAVLISCVLTWLCVCRYYVAEGVRIYNQETWRQVMAGGGRQLVEQHIQPVVGVWLLS